MKDKTHSKKKLIIWGNDGRICEVRKGVIPLRSLQLLLPQNSPQMEWEKVMELFGKPTPNSKKQKFLSLSFTQKINRVLLLRRRISIINRWDVAFPAEALELLKQRHFVEMRCCWAIEIDFNEAAFEWSLFFLGRFVLEVQGLFLLESWDFTTQIKELLLFMSK